MGSMLLVRSTLNVNAEPDCHVAPAAGTLTRAGHVSSLATTVSHAAMCEEFTLKFLRPDLLPPTCSPFSMQQDQRLLEDLPNLARMHGQHARVTHSRNFALTPDEKLSTEHS
jgi:hypothetical protein